MALPTLPGLKAHLNMSGVSQDAELLTFLIAARRMIENHTGPLEVVTVTESVWTSSRAWALTTRPVVSVTSAVSNDTSVTVSDLEVDSKAGVVRSLTGSLAGTWEVTYTAGMTSVPDNVELAVYVTAQHLWKSQRGGGARPGQGPDVPGSAAGYALPYMAVELLAGDDSSLGFA